MDRRLTALEKEMKKSMMLKRRSNELREQRRILDCQPTGIEKTGAREATDRDIENKEVNNKEDKVG